MAERVYHLAKANYNFEVSTYLVANTKFVDWAVTSLFYSSLHLVDALLSMQEDLPEVERNPRKHSSSKDPGNGGRGRNQLVQAIMPGIKKQYRSLEEASRRSRYDLEMLDKNAYSKLLNQYKDIKNYITMQLLVVDNQIVD